jgi:Fe-S-cluster containining protein
MDLNFDPMTVERAGSLKWDENLRFRLWLKNKSPEAVTAAVDLIGRKVSEQVDCTQCANCCKGLSIAPKSTDVKRLSDGLGLSPYEFKTKYLKKDHEGDLVFKQRPCPFLKSNRCSVYEHRPETCRSYPHLEKQHMLGRGWYVLENTRICPIVYNTFEMLKAHFGYRDRIDADL